MDRLKDISSSIRSRVPGAEQKSSYAGASNSRSFTPPATKSPTSPTSLGGKLKGYVPDRVSGIVGRVSGGQSEEGERAPKPITTLRDPKSFAPPPKHRAVYGDEAANASIMVSPTSPTRRSTPELPRYRTVENGRNPPPPPPRLPPRHTSFPESSAVAEEDVRVRGGLSTGATNAMGRLGRSGISVPGFESVTAQAPPPNPRDRPSASSNTEGTSYDDKKAAVKTASSFYKDPSKVSFSDARAAATTARNFQQRHGDQVAAGAEVANKYRLAVSSSRVTPTAAPPSPPPVRYQSQPPPQHLPSKKKPPPLPPKKKPPPPIPVFAKPPPPPIPATTRPPLIPRSSRPSTSLPGYLTTSLPNSGFPTHLQPQIPTDIGLDLSTGWFTSNPLRFPPSLQNKHKSLRYSTSWSRSASGRTNHVLILAVLWTQNLSSTKIRLAWDAAAPEATIKAEQRHFAPPPPLSSAKLQQLAQPGHAIVGWCEQRMGTQVGNGECWTLAFEALQATPGVMPSQQTTHGACIYSHYPPHSPQESHGVDICPGDVLQFWKAEWVMPNDGWKKAGDPDHTAIVIGARRELGGTGWVCQVLEQNVGGVKVVQRGEFEIGEGSGMSTGGVRVFRPTAEGWGDIDMTWD